jgi:hypothetical protein
MTFMDWLSMGLKHGWLGEPFCYVHGSPELTEAEERILLEEDGDTDAICVIVCRIEPGNG